VSQQINQQVMAHSTSPQNGFQIKMTMNTVFQYCLLTLLIISQPVSAELFWTYEKDQQKGFLLGSVHFANSSFYPLDKQVMKAYEQSSVLVVEVDEQTIPEAERQQLLKRYGVYPNNETLKDHLKPKTLNVIERLLSEFKIPLDNVKHYRPGLLAVTITAFQAEKLGYFAGQGIDTYFLQKARYKKPIRQIEDFAFQMKLLSKLPDEDDILQDSFNDMADYKVTWEAMMAAWKNGNGNELYKQAVADPLNDYPKLARFFDTLFFDRHPRMVKSVDQCVSNKETCFIVLGAGHMLGEKGIVALLTKQGYRVTKMSSRE